MSEQEEIKQNSAKVEKWTVSSDFKIFLLGVLASFLGCLTALCLFSAVKRPPTGPKHCPKQPRYEAVKYIDVDVLRPPHQEFNPANADKPLYKHHKKFDGVKTIDKAPLKQTPKTQK